MSAACQPGMGRILTGMRGSPGLLENTTQASEPRPRGELRWIEWIGRRSAGRAQASPALELGIGDDCAILRPPAGEELLVTTDFTLEGRHFRRDWHPPESAGHRTLARGLSDLAAMGAAPMAAFLSLALPEAAAQDADEARWVERFLEGLFGLAERLGVPLAGGDTSASPSRHVLADIVLLGSAQAGTALRRSGARVGDGLYVSGSLGGAAAELRALERAAAAVGSQEALGSRSSSGAAQSAQNGKPAAHPQLYPEPRLAVGSVLRAERLATACLDLSDGLSTDLRHLCLASGVGAVVDAAALPGSAWLGDWAPEDAAWAMLHGGEDYELLFTASHGTVLPSEIAGVPITRIGEIVASTAGEPTVRLRHPGPAGSTEEPLQAGGWEHLR